MKARYIITDDERYFPVRFGVELKEVATLIRPRVLDYNGHWELVSRSGECLGTWEVRPTRTEVTQALVLAGYS